MPLLTALVRNHPGCLSSVNLLVLIETLVSRLRARGALSRPLARKQSMASGTVKWFNATKGFGFIQPDSGGKDVFVHISAVERAGLQGLHEGQKISYDVVNERGKDAAANLKA
jgi:cold shock protein